MSTITSREFNRDVSSAKRAASKGPVIITDRGEPAFVLMSIETYRARGLSGDELLDRLGMSDEIEVEFEPLRLELNEPEL